MADLILNITIPEVIVPRLQSALGVNTKAEFETMVKNMIKQQVVDNEVSATEALQKAKVQAEQDAIATKMEATSVKSTSEIVL